ncbi:MAG: hypothetical protein Q8R00_03255 [Candidatus Nanoarchaeia archaeon]|nr:hypothetical protein [Candidatus Nanoarchaeia archaeon]
MKTLYLLLLLIVFLTGCSISQTTYNYAVGSNDSGDESVIEPIDDLDNLDDIDDIIDEVENVVEEDKGPVYDVTQDGARIVLEKVERIFLNNVAHVSYNFKGQELLDQNQDLLDWNLYIYKTKSDLYAVELCTAEQINSKEWEETYCIDLKLLESFSEDIKLVYTNRDREDLMAISDTKMDNLDRVYIFDSVRPE